MAHPRRKYDLVEIDQVPVYVQRPHIISGYRPEIPEWDWTLSTFLTMHNETINIWTHFLSLLGFVVSAVYQLEASWNDPSDVIAAWLLFYGTTCFCFLGSTTYHLMQCHSSRVYHFAVKFDYVGIFFMISGCSVSTLRFALYCYPFHVYYMVAILIVCSVGCVLAVLPIFDAPRFRPTRLAYYTGTVALALLSAVHGSVYLGMSFLLRFSGLVGLYLVGLVFLGSRFPECRCHRRFDNVCASHQIWHVFVTLGALWNLSGMQLYYEQVMPFVTGAQSCPAL